MKKYIAALSAVVLCLAFAGQADAQSRSRNTGGGSFSSAFQRGLGFSLGVRLGGGGFVGGSHFGSAGLVSRPLFLGGGFHDPFAFRQPIIVRPAVRFAPAVRFVETFETESVIVEPIRTERIIIVR